MKLEDWGKIYLDSAKQASELVRQLAFGAIALVWIFKKDTPAGPTLDPRLLQAALLAAATLGLDLLQHLSRTILLGAFYRHHDRRGVSLQTDVRASRWVSIVIWVMFMAKVCSVLWCYGALFMFLSSRLLHP